MPKMRREFSPEFKREAVALLESSGRPLMQVATEVGISPSMCGSALKREPARAPLTELISLSKSAQGWGAIGADEDPVMVPVSVANSKS